MPQFPTNLPIIDDILPGQTLAQAQHAAKHNQMGGEIEALATKVGVDNSADPNSIDKKLSNLTTQVNNLGAGFGANTLYEGEIPSGSINGTNKIFTTPRNFITGTLKVYRNGIRLRAGGHDYTVDSATQFTMTNAPLVGSVILVDYSTSTGTQGNAQTLGGLTLAEIKAATLSDMYPIGSIYTNAVSPTNPATLLGIGTWVEFGAGRVPVGVDVAQTEFDTPQETGGAKTHTLTEAQIPAHRHVVGHVNHSAGPGPANPNVDWSGYLHHSSWAGNGPTDAVASASYPDSGPRGGGGAHNNLQPYITVYMWRRTA